MASSADTASYIVDQLSGVHGVSTRKMFGEFAVYVGDKVVALICDDQLFVKPTEAGRKLIGKPLERSPFPQAKPFFLIAEELDDREFLRALIIATANELPLPKPRKPKVAKSAKVPTGESIPKKATKKPKI